MLPTKRPQRVEGDVGQGLRLPVLKSAGAKGNRPPRPGGERNPDDLLPIGR